MPKLYECVKRACDHLGLEIDRDYLVPSTEPDVIIAIFRVACIGGPKGMLVFENYIDVEFLGDCIVNLGYGYTVMNDPLPNETFNLEEYKKLFIDWGWAGPRDSKPSWFND